MTPPACLACGHWVSTVYVTARARSLVRRSCWGESPYNASALPPVTPEGRVSRWLFHDLQVPAVDQQDVHASPWWQVMCLTGVDYFSTLGYQPGIAFLAAGYVSPFATVVLVLVTMLGALPAYARVAELSPRWARQYRRA